jgi:hypothetical protein
MNKCALCYGPHACKRIRVGIVSFKWLCLCCWNRLWKE